jgi:peptidoglycan/LPS O-acetylase OafA/YrhL
MSTKSAESVVICTEVGGTSSAIETRTVLKRESSGASYSYRPDIDGLRAVAILSVVLFHAGVPGVTGGFVGVDIFFVISGFLIGGHIYSDLQKNRFSFLEFYKRRAKRILPPLFVVLTALMVVAFFLFSPYEFRRLSSRALATVLSLSNVLFWKKTNYFNPGTESEPLLMTWSLGVEEQFYLVIPILLLLLFRLRRRFVLPATASVLIASLVWSAIQLSRDPVACFYMLPSRAWELAVGVLLALSWHQLSKWSWLSSVWVANTLSGCGTVLIVLSCYRLTITTPFPGPAAIAPVLGAATLILSHASSLNHRILGSAAMSYVGRVSYSWYLWHWPLLACIRLCTGGKLPIKVALCALLFSFLLAVLSYHFVEKPLRASRQAAKPLLLRYAAISLAMATAFLFIYKREGFPERYPQLFDQEHLDDALSSNPCILTGKNVMPPLTCYDPASSRAKLVVWGDSHAGALMPALKAKAEASGYTFSAILHTGCPPLIGVARYDLGDPNSYKDCLAFNKQALHSILDDPSIKTVVLESWWESTFDPEETRQLVKDQVGPQKIRNDGATLQLFDQALRQTLQTLLAAQKKVVVFNDSPTFKLLPVMRLRTSQNALRLKFWHLLGGTTDADPGFDVPNDDDTLQSDVQQILRKDARDEPGVEFWDLRKPLCSAENLCRYREGTQLYYIDDAHLSPLGADRALASWTPPPLH